MTQWCIGTSVANLLQRKARAVCNSKNAVDSQIDTIKMSICPLGGVNLLIKACKGILLTTLRDSSQQTFELCKNPATIFMPDYPNQISTEAVCCLPC